MQTHQYRHKFPANSVYLSTVSSRYGWFNTIMNEVGKIGCLIYLPISTKAAEFDEVWCTWTKPVIWPRFQTRKNPELSNDWFTMTYVDLSTWSQPVSFIRMFFDFLVKRVMLKVTCTLTSRRGRRGEHKKKQPNIRT